MNAPNFNLVAPCYDFLARMVFGGTIKRSQIAFFHYIKPDDHVLIIGGGTGWILEAMLKEVSPIHVTYVEASKKMLELAQKRVKDNRVHWVHGTQDEISQEKLFDVIFTAYFLDVFASRELPNVVNQLKSHLKPEGHWLFADFIKESWLVKLAYFFFRLTTGLKNQSLPDYDIALKNFEKLEEQKFYQDRIAARVYLSK